MNARRPALRRRPSPRLVTTHHLSMSLPAPYNTYTPISLRRIGRRATTASVSLSPPHHMRILSCPIDTFDLAVTLGHGPSCRETNLCNPLLAASRNSCSRCSTGARDRHKGIGDSQWTSPRREPTPRIRTAWRCSTVTSNRSCGRTSARREQRAATNRSTPSSPPDPSPCPASPIKRTHPLSNRRHVTIREGPVYRIFPLVARSVTRFHPPSNNPVLFFDGF